MTKAPRTTITHAQFYSLCEWLKAADLTGFTSRIDVAKKASQALGFDVVYSSMTSAFEATGVELQGVKKRCDRNAVVARALVDLMKSLGVTPPDDLVRVAQSATVKE